MELGGKAANIVFDDAPLDQAVEGIVNGIFFNQGHVCCAGSRLLVQESIYDAVVIPKLRAVSTLRVGDPLDKNTDIGAINSRAQLEKSVSWSRCGVDEGRDDVPVAVRAARDGFLVHADCLHGCDAEPSHRAGGDLRARFFRLTSGRRKKLSRRRTTLRTVCRQAFGRTRARGF